MILTPRLFRQLVSVTRTEGLGSAARKVSLYLGAKLLGLSFHQMPIINCIRTFYRGRKTYIDIGACVGHTLIPVAKLFELCIAVEPLPQNIEALQSIIAKKKLKNCTIVNCALGRYKGVRAIYVSSNRSDTASLVKIGDLKEGPKVVVSTLDSIVEQLHAKELFLIKIDVQGFEHDVLLGGTNTLDKDCIIISEFWPYGLRQAGSSGRAYLNFIRSKSYSIYDLKGHILDDYKLEKLCQDGDRDINVVTDLLFMRRHRSVST